ncbi:MAG: thioredoxin-disulfide reductase [Planctomycetota bacterium]|nr:MAG: thioredoxin-disulfide reductase [Planctomycetota bacterium]
MAHQVVIIGSGPAGFTAALYLARADMQPILYEGLQPGGQLTITTDVENYPGFPEGVMGPELMDKMKQQAARFGADIRPGFIQSVDLSSRPFKLNDGEQDILADAVIVATGASARLLGVPGEERLMGWGVSACATCDGAFFREQHVAVIGGGDSALEEADFLTRFASKVTVIHRRPGFRASKIMLHRAENNPKIELLTPYVVEEMLSHDDKRRLRGLTLKHTENGELTELAVDGCFVAIGHVPNTQVFGDQLQTDEKGYLVVAPGGTAASVEGVFAGGDVADSIYRQAITAAGTGCMAALDTERWLSARG